MAAGEAGGRSSEAYDAIRQTLLEAIDFADCKPTGARVHHVKVPEADIAAIRASTGLSQTQSARSIGVATLIKPRSS